MTEKQNNDMFTLLLVLQEVNQRFLSELIGSDNVVREFKRDFNSYIKFGDKFRKSWLKRITEAYGEDSAELHEVDADYMSDLIREAAKLKTAEQMEYITSQITNLL